MKEMSDWNTETADGIPLIPANSKEEKIADSEEMFSSDRPNGIGNSRTARIKELAKRYITWKYIKIFLITKVIWTIVLFGLYKYLPSHDHATTNSTVTLPSTV